MRYGRLSADSIPTRPNATPLYGYCGIPLSYWTKEPLGGAEYIQLTLGSLLTEDLHNLQESGLLSDDAELDEMEVIPAAVPEPDGEPISRNITSTPWFDNLISRSHLGNMYSAKTFQQSRGRTNRAEFEITEWTADDDDERGEGGIRIARVHTHYG